MSTIPSTVVFQDAGISARTQEQSLTFSLKQAGTHTGSSAEATELTDAGTGQGFVSAGVEPGDMVINFSDGSIGRVVTVTSETVLVVDDLTSGTDNDFDNTDIYIVVTGPQPVKQNLSGSTMDIRWSQMAQNSRAPVYLTTNLHSLDLGIPLWRTNVSVQGPGKGNLAVAVTPDSQEANIVKLGSSTGHTGSADAANLTDSSKDFYKEGVRVGDTLWNLTDGSWTIVSAVSKHTLTGLVIAGSTNTLYGGTDGNWDVGDKYRVDRMNVWVSPAGVNAAALYPIEINVTEF